PASMRRCPRRLRLDPSRGPRALSQQHGASGQRSRTRFWRRTGDMTWIGRKKLALVPLYRPNAHPPDQIPADWNNQILRRVLFDPDATTKADRSLRAYIHAASSGRAALDAVVLPIATADEQALPALVL